MAGLLLVNIMDVARSLGPDPMHASATDVSQFLINEYLRQRGGGFNHDTAIMATEAIFSGRSSVSDAIEFCRTTGNPKGREQNAQIIETVGAYAASQPSRCYKTGFLAIAIGRFKGHTIFAGLKAPFTRVRGKNAYVVVPGFRKSFAPTDAQLDIPLSLAANQLARDDFSAADVEYLSAGPSPVDDGRMFKVVRGIERKLLSEYELDMILSIYVEGVVRTLESGKGLDRPDLAGYRVVDPDEPSMFH